MAHHVDPTPLRRSPLHSEDVLLADIRGALIGELYLMDLVRTAE